MWSNIICSFVVWIKMRFNENYNGRKYIHYMRGSVTLRFCSLYSLHLHFHLNKFWKKYFKGKWSNLSIYHWLHEDCAFGMPTTVLANWKLMVLSDEFWLFISVLANFGYKRWILIIQLCSCKLQYLVLVAIWHKRLSY